jgi:hypothetical protein
VVQFKVICGLLPLQPGVALVRVNAPGTAAKADGAIERLVKRATRESPLKIALKNTGMSIGKWAS